jgi:hypothetical protein
MELLNESRRQLLTNVAKALPLTAVALSTSEPVVAAPKGTSSATALVNSAAAGAGTGGFVGALTVTGVQLVNGVLSAVGQLTGNVLDAAGNVVTSINQAVTVPLQATASCEILTLTLGPLDLNLLGLAIHLNQVVLNITAVPGAGNLLGNLLCSVANLLNGGGALSSLLTTVTDLLNQILAAL